MSIASRITAIEGHIADDYNALEYIGADLTNVDKNIENIKNVLVDIYDEMPKVSDTGTDLTLENTRKGAMSITYEGNTEQDGTPTPDSPVDVNIVSGDNTIEICGKNLLPYPYESSTTTTNGITFTPQSDGGVLVQGTATAQATFSLYGTSSSSNQRDLVGNYLSGGTSQVNLRAYNRTGSTYTNLGTDTGDGVQIDKTTYTTGYIELRVANGTNLQDGVIIYPMMLMSLEDTTYEEYKGQNYLISLGNIELCKIGDYKDFIRKGTGKNLIGLGTQLNGYIDQSTLKFTTNTNSYGYYFKTSNLPDTITFSCVNGNRANIGYFNEVPAQNVVAQTRSASNDLPRTITIDRQYDYIHIQFSYSQVASTFQVEKGSQATLFEPYGFKDKWYWHNEIYKEKPTISTGSLEGNGARLSPNLSQTPVSAYCVLYCTHFKRAKNYNESVSAGNAYPNYLGLNASGQILCNSPNFTSISDYRDLFNNNDIYIYYPLATPTNTEITNTTLLNQLETIKSSYDNVTNISQENNDLSFILDVSALKEWE